MKIRLCNLLGAIAVAWVALAVSQPPVPFGPPAAWAADAGEKAPAEPIEITADKLVTDNQKRTALFSGNVTAVQAGTKLTADRLTIVYKAGNGKEPAGAGDIERLEAQGHVRIEFDNKLAVSNQAVYIIEERKLVLEGPGSKVISDKDEITGSRITFYRNKGTMALEGDENNRVKALIHSDQRGLN